MSLAHPATPRRIALVAACSFPAPRGTQVLLGALARQLAAAGHQVHLVAYGSRSPDAWPPGVIVHRTPWSLGNAARPGLRWTKPLQDLALLVLLWRVVRSERIDVVHAHNYEAPLLSYWVRWCTGVPVVYHAHNALGDELGSYVRPGWVRRLAHRVGGWLDGQIPRRADFVVALTPELLAYLHERGVAPCRSCVIAPAGIETCEMAVASARADSRFTVLYAGNLDPYQNLDLLIESFERLQGLVPNPVLELVTHEIHWSRRVDPRIRAWVGEGRALVTVVADFAAVRARMAAADVLVCPRSSWSGFPIKLLNYAASGRPIVVTRGAAKGLEHEVSALVVDDDAPDAMVAALARLWADPAFGRRIGARARQQIRPCADTKKEIAFKFDMIYGKIPSRRKARRRAFRVCGGRPEDV